MRGADFDQIEMLTGFITHFTSRKTLSVKLSFLGFFLTLLLAISDSGFAQNKELSSTGALPSTIDFTVQQGIGGNWKVGYETQFEVAVQSADTDGLVARVTSVDGDGVLIEQSADFVLDTTRNAAVARLVVRHGRANRSIRVAIVKDGIALIERELTEVERGKVLPLEQPWVVGLGPSLQLDPISIPSVRGGLPSLSLVQLNNAGQLPLDSYAYSAVTLLVLGTSDLEFIQSITPEQGEAITDWVARGGRLQLWVGKQADGVAKTEWLAKLFPGEILGATDSVDPAVLESYVASSQTTRLESLTCARVKPKNARTDLSLLSAEREALPFIIHAAYGAGTIDLIATDINSPELLAWKERTHLLERLLDVQSLMQMKSTNNDNTAQFIGYSDLAGQIRASLDFFDEVSSGTIALLSVFAVSFLLLIGPIDFYLLNRSLRKSIWTWSTLFVSCAAIIALTQWLTATWKPNRTTINSLEILDYHFDTQESMGHAFVHQYSGVADRFQLSAKAIYLHDSAEATTATAESKSEDSATYIRWSGKTGAGLGGFLSDVRTDVGMPAYEINRQRVDGQVTSKIEGVGIPTAGTYATRVSWQYPCSEVVSSNGLSNFPGSDLLQGSFTNPLRTDLLSAVLYYESWAYPLKETIKPGETITLSVSTSPRDLARQLQQRRMVDDREQAIPWDRTARRDVKRLVDLLSMYEKCGGKQYVGLDLRYLKELDLSDRLKLNRAVLIAEVDKPVLKWKASTKDKTEVVGDGYRTTIVRLVMPIEDR